MKDDIQSLSHSTWRCKYHIVFAPKYRRQVIYGKIKADIGKILRELSERKGVAVLEAEACPDHIHMLVSILSLFRHRIPLEIVSWCSETGHNRHRHKIDSHG